MGKPTKLTLKGAHVREIAGYADTVVVRMTAYREKRNGALEHLEIEFTGLTDGALYCLQRHVNTRMGRMREYYAAEAERIKTYFPQAEAAWAREKEGGKQ